MVHLPHGARAVRERCESGEGAAPHLEAPTIVTCVEHAIWHLSCGRVEAARVEMCVVPDDVWAPHLLSVALHLFDVNTSCRLEGCGCWVFPVSLTYRLG